MGSLQYHLSLRSGQYCQPQTEHSHTALPVMQLCIFIFIRLDSQKIDLGGQFFLRSQVDDGKLIFLYRVMLKKSLKLLTTTGRLLTFSVIVYSLCTSRAHNLCVVPSNKNQVDMVVSSLLHKSLMNCTLMKM